MSDAKWLTMNWDIVLANKQDVRCEVANNELGQSFS